MRLHNDDAVAVGSQPFEGSPMHWEGATREISGWAQYLFKVAQAESAALPSGQLPRVRLPSNQIDRLSTILSSEDDTSACPFR